MNESTQREIMADLCESQREAIKQLEQQLAAERARVDELEKLHKETNFSLRQWNNQLAEEYAHKRTAIMEGHDNA